MSVPDKAMKLKDGKIIADQLSSMIAVQFVQGTANAAGSYVVYNGEVFYLPNGHTAGTTWANTTKEGPTNIGEINTQLKSGISGKADKEDTVLTSTLSCGRKANTTVGTRSIAYGNGTVEASGNMSTALGSGTTASAKDSVAVGENTKATANNTVAGGYYAEASGQISLAYGYSAKAKGTTSVAFGQHTETNHSSQFVFGERNVPDPSTAAISSRGNYIEIVGNGQNSGYESNARSLDWSGNERLKGDLYVGCNADSTGGTKVAKETVIAPAFDVATANAAGTYVMYTDGVVYYLPDGHTADTTWENTNKTATNIGAELTSVKNAIQGLGLVVDNNGKLCVSFEEEEEAV